MLYVARTGEFFVPEDKNTLDAHTHLHRKLLRGIGFELIRTKLLKSWRH